MSRALAPWGFALLLTMLPLQAFEPPRGETPPEVMLDQASRIPRGTTAAEVRQRLGSPRHVARQILYRHSIEQWVYGELPLLRVEFDRVKGQEPQVLTVRPLPSAKP